VPAENPAQHDLAMLTCGFGQYPALRPYYEAMIQSLDTEIGVVLGTIDRTNTDVIFIGDNGTPIAVQQPPFINTNVPETLAGNGHAKFTIFEGGARTPLIVAGPDVAGPGRTNDTLVNEPDLFSTIQELAGINVAATLPTNVIIDSVSLLPALRADVIRPTPFVIEEQFNQSAAADGITLRNGEFKLIHFYNHTNDVSNERLYDLASDPYEFTNLLAAPLTATAQSNYYSLQLNLGRSVTFENTQYRRTLIPYPSVNNVVFTNGAFYVNEQYTQISTNANTANFVAPAAPTQYPDQKSLDYTLTLWRSPELDNPLAWVPVATTTISSGTNSTLVITNTVLTDAGANADHYFYQVTPYIP